MATAPMTLEQLLALSSAELLKLSSYISIFSPDKLQIKQAYRKLSMKWHPDHAKSDPAATQVFTHVKTLYEAALDAIEQDSWGAFRLAKFETKTSEIKYSYWAQDTISNFGERYTGKLSVCYEIPDSNKDLVDIWIENFKKMEDHTSPYPDMVKIFQPLLNAKPRVYPLLSGSLIRTDKHAEFLNLDHVLRKNKLDPRHVVWIISRLMNLACLMEKTSTPNLDISTNSVYICPSTHEVILLDGWQYARAFNQKAVAAPRKILRLCPDFAVSHHVLVKHVLEQIKALGRELLGDSTGTTLEEKGVPKPLSTWLNKNAGTSATKEFSAWDVVKHESYGKPTFIVLNLTENDVYPL